MEQSEYRTPRFLSVGDRALCIEFGQGIDPAVNERVIALDATLQRKPLPGVIETVPTYRSLLVAFDPARARRDELEAAILARLASLERGHAARRRWHVPVVYGGVHGCDLEDVAAMHGLSSDEVIALHTSVDFRVYMIGFAPGFAYLGGLPEMLHTSRRSDPRPRTPPRSISIGGEQAAICPPLALPSGWHLLGQTPVRSFALDRPERPFLFEAGDMVRFHPVQPGEYEALLAAADAGEDIVTPEALDD